MKNLGIIILLTIFTLPFIYAQKTFHDFSVRTLAGDTMEMSSLKGKKVMVINVASKCGLTPQYKTIQSVYEKYGGEGFEIIAFPANNFLRQEPGSASDIQTFCQKNYGVSFPIMEKINVSNYIYLSYPPDKAHSEETEIHPVFEWLTHKYQNGIMDAPVEWNFQKFLIDENGNLVDVLAPTVKPDDQKIIDWIKK